MPGSNVILSSPVTGCPSARELISCQLIAVLLAHATKLLASTQPKRTGTPVWTDGGHRIVSDTIIGSRPFHLVSSETGGRGIPDP